MPKRAAWTADDLELIDVAAAGDTDRARALLPRANLRATDKSDATALIKAARYGNAECVKLLLKGSFVPKRDRYGLDALMWAASGGHAECVRLLFPRSKPLAQAGHGDTALMSAAEGGHLECVQIWLPSATSRHPAPWVAPTEKKRSVAAPFPLQRFFLRRPLIARFSRLGSFSPGGRLGAPHASGWLATKFLNAP